MKKLLILSLICFIIAGIAGIGICAEDDITQAEVRPDVVKYAIDTVKFLVFTQTAEITYRKMDADGNGVGELKVIFQNIVDDPETEEDETKTEFTQLVNLINNGDNIKASITTAVKIKLGL